MLYALCNDSSWSHQTQLGIKDSNLGKGLWWRMIDRHSKSRICQQSAQYHFSFLILPRPSLLATYLYLAEYIHLATPPSTE